VGLGPGEGGLYCRRITGHGVLCEFLEGTYSCQSRLTFAVFGFRFVSLLYGAGGCLPARRGLTCFEGCFCIRAHGCLPYTGLRLSGFPYMGWSIPRVEILGVTGFVTFPGTVRACEGCAREPLGYL